MDHEYEVSRISRQADIFAKGLNDHKNSAVHIANAATLLPSNKCHDNVETYLKDHPECEPVRGWLVEEFEGFTYFNAHSVVRLKDGTLLEVTSLNRPCRFLEYSGTKEDLLRFGNRLQYPPVDDVDHSPPVDYESDHELA